MTEPLLTRHTPESALKWINDLCTQLHARDIDYRGISFLEVAAAIEQWQKRQRKVRPRNEEIK